MQGLLIIWLLSFAVFGAAALARVKTRFFVAPTAEARRHRVSIDHPLLRVLIEVGLTPVQRAALERMLQAELPALERLGRNTRESLSRMMTLSPADPSYPSIVRAARVNADAQIKLISELQSKIVAELTDEQRDRLLGLTRQKDARQAA
jgi:hypothetical protein